MLKRFIFSANGTKSIRDMTQHWDIIVYVSYFIFQRVRSSVFFSQGLRTEQTADPWYKTKGQKATLAWLRPGPADFSHTWILHYEFSCFSNQFLLVILMVLICRKKLISIRPNVELKNCLITGTNLWSWKNSVSVTVFHMLPFCFSLIEMGHMLFWNGKS